MTNSSPLKSRPTDCFTHDITAPSDACLCSRAMRPMSSLSNGISTGAEFEETRRDATVTHDETPRRGYPFPNRLISMGIQAAASVDHYGYTWSAHKTSLALWRVEILDINRPSPSPSQKLNTICGRQGERERERRGREKRWHGSEHRHTAAEMRRRRKQTETEKKKCERERGRTPLTSNLLTGGISANMERTNSSVSRRSNAEENRGRRTKMRSTSLFLPLCSPPARSLSKARKSARRPYTQLGQKTRGKSEENCQRERKERNPFRPFS